MKTITAISLAMILSACAASTPQEARDLGPDRHYAFKVDTDYQTAYRRILEAARACHQTNLISASQIVNGDLYPDSRTGTITVGLYGMLGTSIYQVIDVTGIDAGHTQVTATFPTGPVDKYGESVRAWATGVRTGC